MRIVDVIRAAQPAFSFEFFPPRDEEGVQRLFQTLIELQKYRPAYISVTYGAGGSTRHVTVDLVRRIKKEFDLEAMAHLTCVGSTKEELIEVLDVLQEAGIENVLALRGDPPQGQDHFVRQEGGLGYASELTELIRSRYNFCIAGACYPEVHPEAASPEADIDALKKKVDAGAEVLISQLFFNNEDYYRFLDKTQKAGITVPIVAGIWPITNVAQVKRISQMCKATLPDALLRQLEAQDPQDRAAVRAVGVEYSTRQCEDLLRQGIPGIHFYTLNRSLATREILDNLHASGFAK